MKSNKSISSPLEQMSVPEFVQVKTGDNELVYKRLSILPQRMSTLKECWPVFYDSVSSFMMVRFNPKTKIIELKCGDELLLSKVADVIKAFNCGFSMEDSLLMMRMDDMNLFSFHVRDVKSLSGEHFSRCVGRICGYQGKTKYAIENMTKTRIVVANGRIHILGQHNNLQVAKRAICDLILGRTAGRVYNSVRVISNAIKSKGL
eukprot:NODE_3_length_80033_cov_0.932970.p49 type:complete len:204 gc:universal NODE_3_length_80033_cov_0.932970:60004-60615(+)